MCSPTSSNIKRRKERILFSVNKRKERKCQKKTGGRRRRRKSEKKNIKPQDGGAKRMSTLPSAGSVRGNERTFSKPIKCTYLSIIETMIMSQIRANKTNGLLD